MQPDDELHKSLCIVLFAGIVFFRFTSANIVRLCCAYKKNMLRKKFSMNYSSTQHILVENNKRQMKKMAYFFARLRWILPLAIRHIIGTIYFTCSHLNTLFCLLMQFLLFHPSKKIHADFLDAFEIQSSESSVVVLRRQKILWTK